MKNKILAAFSFIFLLSLVTSCVLGPTVSGNGNITKEQRDVESFDKIKVTRGLNLYVTQGDEEKLIVEADENLMEHIETEVDNNTLTVTSSAIIRKSKLLKVFVTITNLSEIRATAGSNLNSEVITLHNPIEISGSAGSNVKLKINAPDIEVSASAGSNITLEGNAAEIDLKASAGSNIKAEDLKSNTCKARTSSGANIWTKVTGEFDGNASSGGNIYYYGNPQNTNISKSTGGNVIQRN